MDEAMGNYDNFALNEKMCIELENGIQKGMQQAIDRGVQKEFMATYVASYAVGYIIGVHEVCDAAAVGMLENGIAPEMVAKCCGLPLYEVLQLVKN